MRTARRPALAGVLLGLLLAAVALTGATPAAASLEGAAPAQDSWHADQARVPDARAAGREGEGVLVAVLDSWVDATHPDFGGRVLDGADCLGGTCRPGPARADACDHGTHVAGTVASSSFGVAPRARVLPVRVLAFDPGTAECLGQPADVAAGIRWAVAQGARVLNLSLGPDVPGLTTSASIPAAVAEATAAGAVVVFSAGNDSVPLTARYGEEALVVAATAPGGALAGYSQRGAGVDLAAPGGEPGSGSLLEGDCTKDTCVTSLYPGARYAVAAGTSMAAPHVSGIAALLLGQDPRRSARDVAARLLGTARPLPGAGAGSVDAAAALSVLPPLTVPPPVAAAGRAEPVPTTSPAPAAPATAPATSAPGAAAGAAAAPPAAGEPPLAPPPGTDPEVVAVGSPGPAEVPREPALLAAALVAGAGAGTLRLARAAPPGR